MIIESLFALPGLGRLFRCCIYPGYYGDAGVCSCFCLDFCYHQFVHRLFVLFLIRGFVKIMIIYRTVHPFFEWIQEYTVKIRKPLLVAGFVILILMCLIALSAPVMLLTIPISNFEGPAYGTRSGISSRPINLEGAS